MSAPSLHRVGKCLHDVFSSERRVTEALKDLPIPNETELLVQELHNTPGSQDECIGVTYELILGSSHTFNDVLAEYRKRLLADEWDDVSEYSIHPSFHREEYSIVIEEVDIDRSLLFVGNKYRMLLEKSAKRFNTLLRVSIAFSTCSQ